MADLIDHESLNQDEKGTTATVGDTSSSPCHESFWHQSSQLSQLQRKLKSRHLQMIAIGMYIQMLSLSIRNFTVESS